jgi:hypothetical protein
VWFLRILVIGSEDTVVLRNRRRCLHALLQETRPEWSTRCRFGDYFGELVASEERQALLALEKTILNGCAGCKMVIFRLSESEKLFRPIFIVGAPRSGTTLLFETLARFRDFWTVGGEAHAVFEREDAPLPACGNRREAWEATDAEAHRITTFMRALLRDCQGRILSELPKSDISRIRVLEKTPKNALRVAYLSALFPDSRFIYLYREPHANIASLIEGWNSGRFNTYQINNRPWKFLLPPNWSSLIHRPVEEIAIAQWQSANTAIMDDLSGLPSSRWDILTYDQLIGNPAREINRICQLTEIEIDARAREMLAGPLPHSRSTLTPPDPSKWVRHRLVLDRMMQTLSETDLRVRSLMSGRSASGAD